MFLIQNLDANKTVKARTLANGSFHRNYYDKAENASWTAPIDLILMTATIDAEAKLDVATIDIPNAFIQTVVIHEEENRIVMKIRGTLVEILVNIEDFVCSRDEKQFTACWKVHCSNTRNGEQT